MKEPVVAAQGTDRTVSELLDGASAWKYLFATGLAVVAVDVVDLGMMFRHAQWSSLDWEFGTLGALVQGMPLITLGFGLMCAASVANGWVLARRMMSIVMLLMTLIVLIVTAMFVLDTFSVLKVIQAALKPAAVDLAIKTCLSSFVYFVLYLALGVWTWRRLRVTKGPRG
jgi:hypothetical protein